VSANWRRSEKIGQGWPYLADGLTKGRSEVDETCRRERSRERRERERD